jgi:hypothetical protein
VCSASPRCRPLEGRYWLLTRWPGCKWSSGDDRCCLGDDAGASSQLSVGMGSHVGMPTGWLICANLVTSAGLLCRSDRSTGFSFLFFSTRFFSPSFFLFFCSLLFYIPSDTRISCLSFHFRHLLFLLSSIPQSHRTVRSDSFARIFLLVFFSLEVEG